LKRRQELQADPSVDTQVDGVGAMNAADVKLALVKIQAWLVKFVRANGLDDLGNKLLEINQNYENSANAEKKGEKKNAPTKADQKDVLIDDLRDDSVIFFVVETLHKVICAVMREGNVYRPQTCFSEEDDAKETVRTPMQIIQFCFDHLASNYATGVRHLSSLCLGVLSKSFLGPIVELFLTKMKTVKKEDEQRQYSSYHHAVSFLNFGLGQEAQMQCTMNFLKELAACLKKFDRGVLRHEICESIAAIFSAILADKDAWTRFKQNQSESTRTEYQDAVKSIYATLSKWDSDKHKMWSYNAMSRILAANQDEGFFNTYGIKLIESLYDNFANKAFSADCMDMMRDLFTDINGDHLRLDMKKLDKVMKSMLAKIFPSGSQPDSENVARLTSLTSAIGTKYLDYLVGTQAPLMLKGLKGDYKVAQQAILVNALGNLAKQNPVLLTPHNASLGPLIGGFIEDSKLREFKDPSLLRACLNSFPAIKQSTMPAIQQTAAVICGLNIHPDREICGAAGIALQEVVMLSIEDNLVPVMFAFVDLLKNLDLMQDEALVKLIMRMSAVLDTVILRMEAKSVSASAELAAHWIGLRQHMEGVSMMWMCHHEFQWRREVIKALELLCHPVFRAMEAKLGDGPNVQAPYLLDYLYPGWPSTIPTWSMDQFPSELVNVLVKHFKKFDGIARWVWKELYKSVYELADYTNPEVQIFNLDPKTQKPCGKNEDRYAIWMNRFQFVCYVLRPGLGFLTEAPPAETKGKKKKQVVEEKDLKVDFNIKNRSFRLDSTPSLLPTQVDEFYTIIYNLVHHELAESDAKTNQLVNPCFYECVHAVTERISKLDSENLSNLAAKLLVAIEDEVKFKGNKDLLYAKRCKMFYFHEQTLDIIDRVFFNMTSEFYHEKSQFTTLLHECMEIWANGIDGNAADYFAKLNIRTQRSIASLVSRFFYFRDYAGKPHTDHLPKSYLINRASHYLKLLTHPRLQPEFCERKGSVANLYSEAQPVDHSSFYPEEPATTERVLLEGLYSLAALGPWPVAEQTTAIKFIHAMVKRGAHVYQLAARALAVLLRNNPGLVDTFIRRTLVETHEGVSNDKAVTTHRRRSVVLDAKATHMVHAEATQVGVDLSKTYALLYLKGLVTNWSDVAWVTASNASPYRMIVMSLYHQCSPIWEARMLAKKLAWVLADSNLLSPTKSVRIFTHQTRGLYLQSAVLYGADVVARYPSAIPHVINECARFAAQLYRGHQNMILTILRPWVRAISSYILSHPADQQEAACNSAMVPFLNILNECSGTTALQAEAENLTMALISRIKEDERSLISSIFARFLVNKYAQYLNQTADDISVIPAEPTEDEKDSKTEVAADPGRFSLLKHTVRFMFVALSRTAAGGEMAISLRSHLRTYQAVVPQDNAEYLEWQKTRMMVNERVTSHERAAYELFVNYFYEQQLKKEFVPIILHTAACLFSNNNLETTALYNYIGTEMQIWRDGTDCTLADLLKGVRASQPAICQEWNRLAVQWALNSPDPKVIEASLAIVHALDSESASDYRMLLLSFHMALRNNQVDVIKPLYKVLMTPNSSKTRQDVWTALFGAAYSLLTFSLLSHFQLGLELMSHVMKLIPFSTAVGYLRECPDLLASNKILAYELQRPGDGDKAEVAAVNSLLKGFGSGDTQAATLTVLCDLAALISSTTPTDNRVSMLAIFGSTLLRCKDLNKLASEIPIPDSQLSSDDIAKKSEEILSMQIGAMTSALMCARLSTACEGKSAAAFATAANAFRSVSRALGLQRHAPKGDENDAASERYRSLLQATFAVLPEAKNMFGGVLPSADILAKAVIQSSAPEFASSDCFDFCIHVSNEMFKFSPGPEFNKVLLLVLGNWLNTNRGILSIGQFDQLANLCVANYYTSDNKVTLYSENIAQMMLTSGQRKKAFTFIRKTPAQQRAVASSPVLMQAASSAQAFVSSAGHESEMQAALRTSAAYVVSKLSARAVDHDDEDAVGGKLND